MGKKKGKGKAPKAPAKASPEEVASSLVQSSFDSAIAAVTGGGSDAAAQLDPIAEATKKLGELTARTRQASVLRLRNALQRVRNDELAVRIGPWRQAARAAGLTSKLKSATQQVTSPYHSRTQTMPLHP